MLKSRLFRLKISQLILACVAGILAWSIYGFGAAYAETALFSLNVADGVLEMDLSTNKVSINLAPVNNTTAFNDGSIVVTIGTNNNTGYALTMATEGYETKIPRTAALSDNSIPTINPIPYVSGGYTDATFSSSNDTTNKWGYKTSWDAHYYPFLASDVYVYGSDSSSNGESTTITFAAKVDNTQPAGTYSAEITFTAVANPPEWYYLQDVNTWENMLAVGETVQAIDNRTGYIYDVVKLTDNGTNYLWMKNSLKLPAGKTLTTSDSDVSASFTLPTEEWASSSQNYFCKAIMAVAGGEYYYNWYAAKANPYVCNNPTATTNASSTNDAKSLGSICPKNWTLPTYNDITINTLWNNGADPGVLTRTGYFYGGSRELVGDLWGAWSSARYDNQYAYIEHIYPGGQGRTTVYKSEGYTVRCIHSQQSANKLTFIAGEGIDSIIIANGVNNFAAVYAKPGTPAVITIPNGGIGLIVTVVPRQGYILDSWSGDTANLASQTLLTTTYTTSTTTGGTLTATGTTGSYTPIQSDSLSCNSSDGINVTDSRDGKSYTVANKGYCYMLSNLRLDPGITLTSADSDITPNSTYSYFTTPTVSWTSSSQNYYCKAAMAIKNGEYYYNWYAANANPYECASPTTSTNATTTNDAKSLGSICPKGWKLLDINDQFLLEDLWDNGSNPGLLYTSGDFYSGSQYQVGTYGYWASNVRYDNSEAYGLVVGNGSATVGAHAAKYIGVPVRCFKEM